MTESGAAVATSAAVTGNGIVGKENSPPHDRRDKKSPGGSKNAYAYSHQRAGCREGG